MKLQFIRLLSVAIMLLAGATSYLTQRALFVDWRVDSFTAAAAPISIDLLAVICALAVHAESITRGGRITAVLVLIVAGSGSMAANWIAGVTVGAKAVHLAMVVAYLLAESVASQAKARKETLEVSAVAPAVVEEIAVVRETLSEPVTAKTPRAEVPATAQKPRRKAAGRYHPVETVSASA
jgi:hypothetical protein